MQKVISSRTMTRKRVLIVLNYDIKKLKQITCIHRVDAYHDKKYCIPTRIHMYCIDGYLFPTFLRGECAGILFLTDLTCSSFAKKHGYVGNTFSVTFMNKLFFYKLIHPVLISSIPPMQMTKGVKITRARVYTVYQNN